MAYAPTTWDANDVITKDKLNKIEQGINTASKLSGTDIDTDKDWNGKSITNLGGLSIVEAKNVLETTYARLTLAASDAALKTMISGSANYPGTAGAWVSAGSAFAVDQYISGTGTVRIAMSVSVPGGETVSCRILKNGAVAATGNGTYDISCVAGDVFQFQVARSWPTNVVTTETHSCVAKGTVTYNMSPAVGEGKYVPLAREITPENLVSRVW